MMESLIMENRYGLLIKKALANSKLNTRR